MCNKNNKGPNTEPCGTPKDDDGEQSLGKY